MKKTILYLLLLTCFTKAGAQDINEIEKITNAHSDDHASAIMPSAESLNYSIMLLNPDYRNILRSRKDTAPINIIKSSLAHDKKHGDFLHYLGNEYQNLQIGGSGNFSPKDLGTLHIHASYNRSHRNNISWCIVTEPEKYWPYVSTDSIGGNFKYESYQFDSDYGIQLGKINIGAAFNFSGIQSYRETDPRVLTNLTKVGAKLSASSINNGHYYSLAMGLGRDKQYQTMSYWRPGQQDRFFSLHGFGLYDTYNSPVSFGNSRMNYIYHIQGRFTYQSPIKRKWNITALLEYRKDMLETEERNICNLYNVDTHILSPYLGIIKNGHQTKWFLTNQVELSLRQGKENFYDRYLSDPLNNIYDYRKIATRRGYKYHKMRSNTKVGFTNSPSPRVSFGFSAGLLTHYMKEAHSLDDYMTETLSATPYLKTMIKYRHKTGTIGLRLAYGRHTMLRNKYQVDIHNTEIQHLDFQQSFGPYAYRTADYDMTLAAISYAHNLGRQTIILDIHAKLLRGDRLKDVAYTGEIGYKSTAPTITPQADRHNEEQVGTSLSIVF